MKRRASFALAFFGLAALIAVVGAIGLSHGADAATAAGTVQVVRADLVDKALAVGTIEPEVEVSVESKVSGVVHRRFADVGDFVRAGDPLLEIRPDPTPLELVEARRHIELQQLEAETLDRELARPKELKARGLISDQEHEATQHRHAEAALQLQIAREKLALLEQGRVTVSNARNESVLKSPIDGYILEKWSRSATRWCPSAPTRKGPCS